MRCSRSTLWALRERRRPGGLHSRECQVEVGSKVEAYCFRMTYWFPVGVEVRRYVGFDWPYPNYGVWSADVSMLLHRGYSCDVGAHMRDSLPA